MRKRWSWAVVGFLLLTMLLEVGLSTRQESAGWDEGDHIYAGYMNWKHDDYSLNPEHPPLVKLVATLPLLPLHLKVAPRQGRGFKLEAYYGGRELLFRNGTANGGHYSADTLLFRVHMAALLFGLGLALLLFLAGREMFGVGAGLVAMVLFVFDPTVLANAPFVATDMGASCGMFAAVYAFYRLVKQTSWKRAVVCGLAVGFALATKHSTVLLLPILPLLAAGEIAARWRFDGASVRRYAVRLLPCMFVVGAVALVVLWATYSFRFAMHPSGTRMPSLASKVATLSPGMRAAIGLCMRWRLLPESYLYGLADVQQVGLATPTFFLGKVYETGQRMYFPALLSLKWTVGFLALLVMAIGALTSGKVRKPREVFFLVAPAVVFLAVAIMGPLNIGVRHVLPVFPFAFALAGGGAAWLASRGRVWAGIVAVLMLAHAVESVRVFPDYVPFANALWGGPTRTNLYFSDSAADWAQQLKWTKQWVDVHHVTNCSFAYFAAPFLLPSDYGIPCKPLPTMASRTQQDIDVPAVVHGPVLISVATLNGYPLGTEVRNPYQTLFKRKPDELIANAIAVYWGDVRLPEAAAIEFEVRSSRSLSKNPQAALAEAQQAVALVPQGFDANLALGDAELALGNRAAARAAYAVAMARVAEMEPSAQQVWRRKLQEKLAAAKG